MITPLNGIFGLAQILSADSESLTPAEVADFGANILQSAERLHRTVQNFLLYGQLEMQASDPQSGAVLRQKETGQIKLLVETRARHLAEKATRTADLELDLADGSVPIGQDLFTKLVDELIDNAFKFSVAGTTVRVTGGFKDGSFSFSVRDRGHGMDPEQVAGIGAYSQFNRKTFEQQGSGLGLAIARRIAELHGGGLNVESQRDLGTTVTFKLPV
jgi:signal transduction histidine kinase